MATSNKRRSRRQSRVPQNAIPLRNPNQQPPRSSGRAEQGALFDSEAVGQLFDPSNPTGEGVFVDEETNAAARGGRPSPTREVESERNQEARRRARAERREEARRRRQRRSGSAIRLRNPRSRSRNV